MSIGDLLLSSPGTVNGAKGGYLRGARHAKYDPLPNKLRNNQSRGRPGETKPVPSSDPMRGSTNGCLASGSNTDSAASCAAEAEFHQNGCGRGPSWSVSGGT